MTLAIAGAIYWTVSILPQNRDDLRFTLRWFYVGLGVALVWGSLQIIYVLDLIPGWYENLRAVQSHISKAPLFTNRISGMALEPSWFADQLAGLWLPWVLGAVLTDYSVTEIRWGKIKLEHIILIWLLFVLFFTLSRAGLGAALLVILFGVVFFGNRVILSFFDLSRWEGFRKLNTKYPKIIPVLVRGILIICFLVVFFLAFYVVSTQSKYISRMWNFWQNQKGGGAVNYFRYIGFGPRFVYWWTAFRIFSHYPFFGVGLGNYTFHFTEFMPSVQIGYMPELIRRFVPAGKRIITSKNFFAHLLSETGFVGISLFLVFLLLLLARAIRLWHSEDEFEKFWGTSAILSLFAFVVDSFSFGSFAIPNPWINFGLITCTVFAFSAHTTQQRVSASAD
jgi:O-antigen ligase